MSTRTTHTRRGSVASKFKYAIPGNSTIGVARARARRPTYLGDDVPSVRPFVSLRCSTPGNDACDGRRIDSFNSREHRENPLRERHTRKTSHARKPCEGPRRTVGGPFHAAGDNWRHAVRLAAPAPIGAASSPRRPIAARPRAPPAADALDSNVA